MSSRYDVVALGDVNMDFLVKEELPLTFRTLVENGVICWGEIEEVPGGSGLNLCAFASEFGYRALLLGKVGKDTAGNDITKWLGARGIDHSRNWVTGGRTGKALIMRDSSGIRLLVNSSCHANQMLTEEDIQEHELDILSSRVLYVSGYCVCERAVPRFRAAGRAIECARASRSVSRPKVVLDVVPHRIYETFSFDEFLQISRRVDILISEVATMRRFLGMGARSETVDRQMAEETVKAVEQYYDGLMLRFGPSGCDFQILFDREDGELEFEETKHDRAEDKRGFGDVLVVKALVDFFGVLPAWGRGRGT